MSQVSSSTKKANPAVPSVEGRKRKKRKTKSSVEYAPPAVEESSSVSTSSSLPFVSAPSSSNSSYSSAEEEGTDSTKTETCLLPLCRVCICQPCETTRSQLRQTASEQKSPKKSKTARSDPQKKSLTKPQKKTSKQHESSSSSSTKELVVKEETEETKEKKIAKMTEACQTILTCIGEDPGREGLLKTPERWAKALLFMTHGYAQTGADVTNGAVFNEEDHKEMVVVKDIDIHSLCEHHMVPFTGRVHVGYIPNGKILGLSKLARIAEVYARRLQVQERLTRQIADAVVEAVDPLGVAVVIECSHFCMVMRGVQKCGAKTVTSSVRGCFETNSKTRAEFFSIINR